MSVQQMAGKLLAMAGILGLSACSVTDVHDVGHLNGGGNSGSSFGGTPSSKGGANSATSGAGSGGFSAGTGGANSATSGGSAGFSAGTGGTNSASAGSGGSSGRPAGAGEGPMVAGASGNPADNPVSCGTTSCNAVDVVWYPISPCCADAASNHCGLDLSSMSRYGLKFSDACQPTAQPGSLDANCPNVHGAVSGAYLSINFPGCCRPNHTCGYMVDKIGDSVPPGVTLGIGCVDSAALLNGGGRGPVACGDIGGGGSDNGQGGAPGNAP